MMGEILQTVGVLTAALLLGILIGQTINNCDYDRCDCNVVPFMEKTIIENHTIVCDCPDVFDEINKILDNHKILKSMMEEK